MRIIIIALYLLLICFCSCIGHKQVKLKIYYLSGQVEETTITIDTGYWSDCEGIIELRKSGCLYANCDVIRCYVLRFEQLP